MLIKCPECGKQVSDRAANCPECGCQINTPPSYEAKKTEDSGCFMANMNFGCATLGLLGLIIVIYFSINSDSDMEEVGIAAIILAVGFGIYWFMQGYKH